jgi:hypothetical protein
MITKEFFLNFFLTFMLLITISVMLMAIEGGISGFFWLLLVKGIPFFVISILNSIILLIVDLLVTKKKVILNFIPTLILLLYFLLKVQTITKNYGTKMFVFGIFLALFFSNYLRTKRIDKI